MGEVGLKGSGRDFRRGRWGRGPAPGRAEMPASLANGAHDSSAPSSSTSTGNVGWGAARRLACLQLMEVTSDVRAPWGGTSCAMTPESPL